MRVEALSKALIFYDLTDVFQILDNSTVKELNLRLTDLETCQATEQRCELDLLADPSNLDLVAAKTASETSISLATTRLQATTINTTDLIRSFKDLDESTIRQSNAHYTWYGANHLVENLA